MDEEHTLTLCVKCAHDQRLRDFIQKYGTATTACSLCGEKYSQAARVGKDAGLADIIKALVRFHYSEFDYNRHWGGNELYEILAQDNPILHFSGPTATDAFAWFIEKLTEPAYPPANEGVSLYYGRDGTGRGAFGIPLSRQKSRELEETRHALRKQNHFELEDPWLDRLGNLRQRLTQTVKNGSHYFRARIGVASLKLKTTDLFEEAKLIASPYSGDQIGSPPPHIVASGGRLNRPSVSFLYLTDTAETALAELRPHSGHYVSIGCFVANSDLEVANLARVDFGEFMATDQTLDQYVLLQNLNRAFSKPVVPDADGGYLLTQFIAGILRKLGFSGVVFSSSLGAGLNLAVFQPSLFSYVPRSGTVRQVTAVSYTTEDFPFEHEEEKDAHYF
ncbi:MAG: RES family NAD+ phosphorylase [Myxococcota bacterium]